jgi:hypothetical protein
MRASCTPGLVVCILILGLVCGVMPSARADMWTNAAGHALEARLVGGDEQAVILQRPNGMRISMPVLSLSPEARQMAVSQLEKISPDARKKAEPNSSAGFVAGHARDLRKAGLINDTELAATLGSLGSASTNAPPVRSARP